MAKPENAGEQGTDAAKAARRRQQLQQQLDQAVEQSKKHADAGRTDQAAAFTERAANLQDEIDALGESGAE
jgi:hypothetical protein